MSATHVWALAPSSPTTPLPENTDVQNIRLTHLRGSGVELLVPLAPALSDDVSAAAAAAKTETTHHRHPIDTNAFPNYNAGGEGGKTETTLSEGRRALLNVLERSRALLTKRWADPVGSLLEPDYDDSGLMILDIADGAGEDYSKAIDASDGYVDTRGSFHSY